MTALNEAAVKAAWKAFCVADTDDSDPIPAMRAAIEAYHASEPDAVAAERAWDDLASFGHDRKRTWLLWFEDNERHELVFDDEVQAHKFYEAASVTWNCTLFETATRRSRSQP